MLEVNVALKIEEFEEELILLNTILKNQFRFKEEAKENDSSPILKCNLFEVSGLSNDIST